MLYSPKEEAKRSRWKKHWLEQKLLAQSYIKLSDLRKGNVRKQLRKAV